MTPLRAHHHEMSSTTRLPLAALIASLVPVVLLVIEIVLMALMAGSGSRDRESLTSFVWAIMGLQCGMLLSWLLGLGLSIVANRTAAALEPAAKRAARSALFITLGTGTLCGAGLAASMLFAIYQRAR